MDAARLWVLLLQGYKFKIYAGPFTRNLYSHVQTPARIDHTPYVTLSCTGIRWRVLAWELALLMEFDHDQIQILVTVQTYNLQKG